MRGEWVRLTEGELCLVFVHGFFSSLRCWQHDNGTFWPELVRDEKGFDTVSVYTFEYNTGFFSGKYSLGEVAASLKEHLKLEGILDKRQVIFVCHSMGGIVVRKFILRNVLDLYEQNSTIGLFLIASPSLGSEYANFFTAIAKFLGHSQADALRFSESNVWLNDLDEDFKNLKESRKLIIFGKELIEDKSIKKLPLPPIVRRISAARYFKEPYKVPLSDHITIAKPEDNNAIQHRLLCKFIREVVQDSDNVTRSIRDERIPDSQISQAKRLSQATTSKDEVFKEIRLQQDTQIVGPGHTLQAHFPFTIFVCLCFPVMPTQGNLDIDNITFDLAVVAADSKTRVEIARQGVADLLQPGVIDYEKEIGMRGLSPGAYLLRTFVFASYADIKETKDILVTVE